jgi:hypothetical protein
MTVVMLIGSLTIARTEIRRTRRLLERCTYYSTESDGQYRFISLGMDKNEYESSVSILLKGRATALLAPMPEEDFYYAHSGYRYK